MMIRIGTRLRLGLIKQFIDQKSSSASENRVIWNFSLDLSEIRSERIHQFINNPIRI